MVRVKVESSKLLYRDELALVLEKQKTRIRKIKAMLCHDVQKVRICVRKATTADALLYS